MLNWILSSTILIAAVLILRRLFREKLSLRWQYALWGLVLLRLLVPFTFGSSPMSMERVTRQVVEYTTLAPVVRELAAVQPLPETAPAQPVSPAKPTAPAAPGVQPRLALPWWGLVWMGGSLLVAGLFLSTNARFSRKLRSASPIDVEGSPLPVYVAENIETPCLFGVLHPAVYLTPEVSDNPDTLRHALAHELTHYRHGDHIWSNLRCLCLVIHWFNPLVWLAARLSRQDAELACDEGTIRRLGESERAAYGRTLIAMTCSKKSNPLSAATTMTATGKEIRERIVRMAAKPRTVALALALVFSLSFGLLGCSFAGAPVPPTSAGETGFTSRDGSLQVEVRAALLDEASLGQVTAQYRPLSGEDARQMTRVLFGEQPVYQGEVLQFSAPEVQAYLAVLDSATDSQAAQTLAEGLRSLCNTAALQREPTLCDWTLHLQHGGSGGQRRMLRAWLTQEGVPYTLTLTNDLLTGSHFQVDAAPKVDADGLLQGALERRLGGEKPPTEQQLRYAQRQAQSLLDAMGLGQWQLDGCRVWSTADTEGLYRIAVHAVPRFSVGAALYAGPFRVGQMQSGAAEFCFTPQGRLTHFAMDTPLVERSAAEPGQLLSPEGLLQQAQDVLFECRVEDYAGETGLPLTGAVLVESMQYGLWPTADPESAHSVRYIPAVQFTGEYGWKELLSGKLYTGPDTLPDGSQRILVLDARDGSPLPLYGN